MGIWQQRGIIAAIIVGLLTLILLGIFRGIERADAAPEPSPCASYLSVARDLHIMRLWHLEGQPGGAAFDGVLLAWVNVQTDATVMRLVYSVPLDERRWEETWIARYGQCLTELGGR